MAEAESVIDGYEILNCIATGTTTAIWEVKQAGGQSFAMKLLLPEALKDPEAKASLKHEYAIGKSLDHPNLIHVFDYKLTKKYGYFVMEHMRAGNLKVMIRSEWSVAQGRCKRIMECMSQALGVMHEKGWIHRDLKPENILINKAGDVRLIDFSLASRPTGLFAKALTRKSRIVIQGTRTYLAPELVQRQPLTFAADMYSLGIVLYEILTGNPPFRTANPNELLMMHVREKVTKPSDLNPNVTPELDALVLKMLAKRPKERPQSMNELFAEVRNLNFFKEDPEAHAKAKADLAEVHQKKNSVDIRLDSRADADRQKLIAEGKLSPDDLPKPKPKAKPTAAALREEAARKAKLAAAKGGGKPQPVPAQAPPPMQPYPMQHVPMQPAFIGPYPGMPMPGQPYPGMPQPGMVPPGMPQPGMVPPGPPPGYIRPAMPAAVSPFPGAPIPSTPQPNPPGPGVSPAPPAPAAVPAAASVTRPQPAPPAPAPARPVSAGSSPTSQPPAAPATGVLPRPAAPAPIASPPTPAAPARAILNSLLQGGNAPPVPGRPTPSAPVAQPAAPRPAPAAPGAPAAPAATPVKKPADDLPLANMDDFDFG